MLNQTRDRVGPWLPALFCAVLGGICILSGFWTMLGGGSMADLDVVYMSFMPMCFFFVGAYLAKLRSDNAKLRARLDEIDAKLA